MDFHASGSPEIKNLLLLAPGTLEWVAISFSILDGSLTTVISKLVKLALDDDLC